MFVIKCLQRMCHFLINALCCVKFLEHVVLIELCSLNGKEVFVYCWFLSIMFHFFFEVRFLNINISSFSFS